MSLVLALLAATVLRAAPLTDNRFHPDEALYASFGQRIAHGHDPLLAGVVVDKPPLPYYLLALSLGVFGGSETAAKLPSFHASLVSVALAYALFRRLYGPQTGLAAAWLLALSPMAILFSITAFFDPLLTAALLWAWWAAAGGRRREAAAALALAFAMKQTALFFAPLVLALAVLRLPASATPREAARTLTRMAGPLLAGLAVTAGLIFAWDVARDPVIGFWSQGYSDNVPGRLARSGEVLPRARAWVDLLHYATGSTAANGAALLGVGALLLAEWRKPSRRGLADRLLVGFCVWYLAGYWLLAFNVWDRYLLPIVPLVLGLGARAMVWAGGRLAQAMDTLAPKGRDQWRTRMALGAALSVTLAVMLAEPALAAAKSRLPVGGDHGAYDGIDSAADYLRGAPAGSVLYDHWLSWEWGFYLYDGPVYVSWFPTPGALATDLRAFGGTSPRYLAVPAWEGPEEIWAAVKAAGYEAELVYTAYRRDGEATIRVYELRPEVATRAWYGAANYACQPVQQRAYNALLRWPEKAEGMEAGEARMRRRV